MSNHSPTPSPPLATNILSIPSLRPENISTQETTLTLRNSPTPWHALDYTLEYQGITIFSVHGHPWSIGRRRVFFDRSGLPLFELRARWYSSSVLDLRLPGGGGGGFGGMNGGKSGGRLLSARLRVAVCEPRVVVVFWGGSDVRDGDRCGEEEEVTLKVIGQDLYNLVQVVVVRDSVVARFSRVTDPSVLVEGQRPPFRMRPMWEVRVARGVDLSLVAVVGVIVGQRAGGVN